MPDTGAEHNGPNDFVPHRTGENVYAGLAKQSGDEAPVEVVTPQENLWDNKEALASEIRSKAVPVDYQEIMGQSRVLMLGEAHDHVAARNHIYTHAKELKAAGITHYAIEAANDPAIQRLNEGQPVDLADVDLGPHLPSDKSDEHAVRAMSRNGIKVVAVDIAPTSQYDLDVREDHITTAIKDILDKDPEAKVAVLIGVAHTMKKSAPSAHFPYAAGRLESLGVPVVSAPIVGSRETTPSIFFEATEAAGKAYREFTLDLRPYSNQHNVIFGAGAADILINVPGHN